MIISNHCKDQARLRDLESELAEGLRLIRESGLSELGEVNFIVERKSQILHREGSSGDLVIIGTQDCKIVKSVFLQRSAQVRNRQSKGRVYCSLLK